MLVCRSNRMILSTNGVLNVLSAYVNLITLAFLLHMSTETTQRFAKYPIVKAVMLFSFAFASIPHKLPCFIATLLFFIIEVKDFLTGAASTIKAHGDE